MPSGDRLAGKVGRHVGILVYHCSYLPILLGRSSGARDSLYQKRKGS